MTVHNFGQAFSGLLVVLSVGAVIFFAVHQIWGGVAVSALIALLSAASIYLSWNAK